MSLRVILEPHVKYVQSLPPEIIESLLDYAGEKYNEINIYLHQGEAAYDNYISSEYSFDDIKNAIHNIDTAFENAPPLEEPLILFRGIRSYNDKYYVSKGYMSTSLNIAPAQEFIGLYRCCIMVITVPVGAKIIAIRSMKKQIKNPQSGEEEDEILLDRDSTLMVVGYGKDEISGMNLIYCVYVPKQAVPMDILTEDEKETVEDTRTELAKKQILKMLRPYTNSKNLDHYMGQFIKSYGLEDTKEMRKILKKEIKEMPKPQKLHRPKVHRDEMEL